MYKKIKNVFISLLTTVLVISFMPSKIVLASSTNTYDDVSYSNIVEGELIVTYKKKSNLKHVDEALDNKDVSLNDTEETIVEVIDDQTKLSNDTALLTLDEDESTIETLYELEELNDVESVQPNFLYSLDESEETVDDSGISNCYYLDNIYMKQAWKIAKTNQAVTVAVVDTGCNLQHEDLINNLDVDNAYDVVNKDYLKNVDTENNGDVVGHGTHVCGLIAAEANNSIGMAGTSYNAKILPINVFEYSSSSKGYVASTSSLISALSYIDTLIGNGRTDIKVINMSLGGYLTSSAPDKPSSHRPTFNQPDSTLETSINNLLKNRQVLTVCAAGNESTSAYRYPSDYDACISVEASTSTNTYSSYTNISSYKDITAPGDSIYSCLNTGGYGKKSGTSMATPIVSGIVALLYATVPSATAEEVREALYTGTTEIVDKKSNDGSHGIVNAYNAIVALQTLYGIQTTCSHSNGTVIKNQKVATCKDSGYTGDTCCVDCGEVITKGTIIEKLTTHTYDAGFVTTAATCEEEGIKAYTCTVCGAVKEELIDALGHDYGAWVSISTEQHQRVCSHDVTHVETETHDLTYTIVTPSTLNSTGSAKYTCSICHYVNNVVLPLATCSHSSTTVKNYVAATCTTDGYTGDTYCNACNTTITTGTTILATGHNVTKTAAKSATCTTTGNSEYYTCSNCGKYFDDEDATNEIVKNSWIIPTIDHTYSTVTVVAPTCTSLGYTLHKCQCGATYKDHYTGATGHNDNTAVTGYGSAWGSCGYHYCSKCNATWGAWDDRHDHNYSNVYTVAPTQTANGYTVHACSCGASYTDSVTPAGVYKSVKYSKVKKKKQTVSCKLSSSAYKKATYKKTSGSSKLSISSKGVVTVKKGTKKGTYTIKVKVTVKKTKKTKAKTKTYTVSITVV